MANKQIYQLTETLSVSPDDWLAIDLDSSNLTRKARVGNVFSVSEGSSYSGGTADGVMFNDGGTFTTSTGLLYEEATTTLSVGGNGVGDGEISLRRSSSGTSIGSIYVNSSHVYVRENQGSGGILSTYDNQIALHWRRHGTNDNRVQINPISGVLFDATFQVNLRADTIGQAIYLSNGQTADAFQINSYGNTGGDLVRVEDDGKTFVNGSSFSGISRTFNVGGAIGIGTGSYQLAWSPNWTGGVSGIGTTSIHSFGIATAGVLGLVQDTSQNVSITNNLSTNAGDFSVRPLDSVPSIQGIYFKGTTGSNWQIAANSSVTYIGASNNVQIWSSGIYRGSIQSAGWHIGDSQISPSAKLHTTLSTDVVGHRLDLSNGQTADAFQINSYGNTGGDLFKVTSDGKVSIGGTGNTSRAFMVQDTAGNGFQIAQDTSSPTKGLVMLQDSGAHKIIGYENKPIDFYRGSHVMRLSSSQTVSIGKGAGDADASAILEIDSTTQGVLLPRMTTTERDAISSPATGLLIFNTTTKKLDYYSGTAWGQV